MEKPRVERERACERACGTYLEIVRRTLARERVVVCVVHGVVRRRVMGRDGVEIALGCASDWANGNKNKEEKRTCEGCVCRLLSQETGIRTRTL